VSASWLEAALGASGKAPGSRRLVLAPGPRGPSLLAGLPQPAAGGTVVYLDSNRQRLQASASNGRVLGRATRLPFRRHSFELVVAFEALFAIRPPWTIIAEFHRVLVPDGKLVLLEPAREGLLSGFRAKLLGPGKRVYELEELEGRLTRADFQIEHAAEQTAAPYPGPAFLIQAIKKENMAEPVPQIVTTREMRAKQKPYPRGEELP